MRLLIPILFFGFISCNARTEYEYNHEDDLCSCYEDVALEKRLDFKGAIERVETTLIDQQVLKNEKGSSYVNLIQEIVENGRVIVEWAGEADSPIAQLALLKSTQECAFLRLKNYNSKVNELNYKLLEIALSKESIIEAVWQAYMEVLEPEDFEHNLYKSDVFIMLYGMSEVDVGISRELPLKRDVQHGEPYESEERDIFLIQANDNDNVFVQGVLIQLEDLEDMIIRFYTINKIANVDDELPAYHQVNITLCEQRIVDLEENLEVEPGNMVYTSQLDKWKLRLELCQEMPGDVYEEMSAGAVIKLENAAGTSYSLYINIQNVLKKVINDLRSVTCEEIWGKDYCELDDKNPTDQHLLRKLRILVPERIIEAKIER